MRITSLWIEKMVLLLYMLGRKVLDMASAKEEKLNPVLSDKLSFSSSLAKTEWSSPLSLAAKARRFLS